MTLNFPTRSIRGLVFAKKFSELSPLTFEIKIPEWCKLRPLYNACEDQVFG